MQDYLAKYYGNCYLVIELLCWIDEVFWCLFCLLWIEN